MLTVFAVRAQLRPTQVMNSYNLHHKVIIIVLPGARPSNPGPLSLGHHSREHTEDGVQPVLPVPQEPGYPRLVTGRYPTASSAGSDLLLKGWQYIHGLFQGEALKGVDGLWRIPGEREQTPMRARPHNPTPCLREMKAVCSLLHSEKTSLLAGRRARLKAVVQARPHLSLKLLTPYLS